MPQVTSRAGRWLLALTLGALGACADEPLTTAPRAHATPNLAVGDVITVTNTSGGREAGSLRWAVAQATGGEVIRFDPSLAGKTIALDSTLTIQHYVTIEGPRTGGITISGGGKGRVMSVHSPSPADPATTLRNLSITGGKLTITDGGAGIDANSALILEHSTVWGNESFTAPAIRTPGYGPALTLVNSTVSGNVSTGGGMPAVLAGGGIVLANSTVAHNSQGGVGVPYRASVLLRGSVLSNNGAANCATIDAITYDGVSISDDESCGDARVVTIADPKLEALRDNGGPGMTHALAASSPALNAAVSCAVAVDQRYVARDAQCDAGSFEGTAPTTVTITVDASVTLDPVFGTAVVSGTLVCSRAGDTFGLQVRFEQRSVEGTTVVPSVTCGTSPQRWSAVVLPPMGSAFRNGGATVTVTTQQAPDGVTPATTTLAVKVARPRK